MGRKQILKRIYDNEGNLIGKECSCCHEIKLVSEFYKDIDKSDKLQPRCKECDNKRHPKKGRKILIRNYDDEGNLTSKECSHCHKIKPVSKFNKREKVKDGLHSECKECRNKRYQKKKKQIERNYDDKGNLISQECTYCHEIKPVSKFNKDTNTKDGLRLRCKECENKRYDKKTQEALQQNKKEIESNPEKYNYNGDKDPFGIIYSVHNIKSNRYYVGQTKTTFDIRYPSGWLHVHGRKNEVKEDLELYGENSFEYNKLLDVAYSQYELDKKEAYYIDYYDSYKNGYNGNRGNIFTNRGKEK